MYQILAILIPLITTPYVSRILGAEGVGIYNYTSGIVSYFGLIAATGTVNYAQREISTYENDRYKRSQLFWEIFLFRCFCSVIAIIGYTIFTFSFMSQYRIYYIIQYLIVISWLVDISWYFQGTENFKITAIRNSIVKILGTGMIFLFVKQKEDLWLYIFILSLMTLLGNMTMWNYLRNEVIRIPLSQLHVFKNTKNIIQLFVPVISIQLYTVLDKTMLGSLSSTLEVGYYSQAEKIIKLALTILSALISVMLPRISALYKTNNFEAITSLYNKTVNFIFLLATPMLVGCLFISKQFVPIFFGAGYEPVAPLMQIESLLFIILSLGQLFGNFLIAMNKQTQYTIAVTSAAIVNIIFNTIFIHFFNMGAFGAAASSILAETISTSIQFWYARQLLKIKPILKAFFTYIIPCLIMAATIILVQFLFSGIIELICSVVAGCTVYFSVLLISKNEIIISTLNQVIKKLKNPSTI